MSPSELSIFHHLDEQNPARCPASNESFNHMYPGSFMISMLLETVEPTIHGIQIQ